MLSETHISTRKHISFFKINHYSKQSIDLGAQLLSKSLFSRESLEKTQSKQQNDSSLLEQCTLASPMNQCIQIDEVDQSLQYIFGTDTSSINFQTFPFFENDDEFSEIFEKNIQQQFVSKTTPAQSEFDETDQTEKYPNQSLDLEFFMSENIEDDRISKKSLLAFSPNAQSVSIDNDQIPPKESATATTIEAFQTEMQKSKNFLCDSSLTDESGRIVISTENRQTGSTFTQNRFAGRIRKKTRQHIAFKQCESCKRLIGKNCPQSISKCDCGCGMTVCKSICWPIHQYMHHDQNKHKLLLLPKFVALANIERACPGEVEKVRKLRNSVEHHQLCAGLAVTLEQYANMSVREYKEIFLTNIFSSCIQRCANNNYS